MVSYDDDFLKESPMFKRDLCGNPLLLRGGKNAVHGVENTCADMSSPNAMISACHFWLNPTIMENRGIGSMEFC